MSCCLSTALPALTNSSPELDLVYSVADVYEKLVIISVQDILCQVARVRYDPPDGQTAWISTSLQKVRNCACCVKTALMQNSTGFVRELPVSEVRISFA